MINDQEPTTNSQRPTTGNFSIIGKPIAMVDAAGKSTGSGKYADDLNFTRHADWQDPALALSARHHQEHRHHPR